MVLATSEPRRFLWYWLWVANSWLTTYFYQSLGSYPWWYRYFDDRCVMYIIIVTKRKKIRKTIVSMKIVNLALTWVTNIQENKLEAYTGWSPLTNIVSHNSLMDIFRFNWFQNLYYKSRIWSDARHYHGLFLKLNSYMFAILQIKYECIPMGTISVGGSIF